MSLWSQDLVKYNFFKEIQKITPSLRGSFASEPEKLVELRRIEQVAEHNRIALNIINQVGPGDPSLRVSFEFTHHPHFAVAIVKRSWFKFGLDDSSFTHPYILIVIVKNSLPNILHVASMFVGTSEHNALGCTPCNNFVDKTGEKKSEARKRPSPLALFCKQVLMNLVDYTDFA